MVLTLTPAPSALSDPPLSLDHLQPLSLWQRSPDEQYLVADDDHGRHRLALKGRSADVPLALALPVDAAMPIRLGAASRLAHAGGAQAATYQPTTQQRARLALLLDILDAEGAGLPKRAIAETLVYPHMRALHGAAWKASAERRRVHRLCEEATRLRDTGVHDLLHARLHPAG